MVFPSEILPVVHLAAAMVNHLVGITILLGFLIVLGPGISIKLLWVFPYLLAVTIFMLGISWLLSALNVFLRDVGQVVGVLLNIWFFLTPIIYPLHLIPESLQGIFGLNPMLYVVEGYRMALLGKAEMDFAGLSYILVLGLMFFVLGGLTFKKLRPVFADVL